MEDRIEKLTDTLKEFFKFNVWTCNLDTMHVAVHEVTLDSIVMPKDTSMISLTRLAFTDSSDCIYVYEIGKVKKRNNVNGELTANGMLTVTVPVDVPEVEVLELMRKYLADKFVEEARRELERRIEANNRFYDRIAILRGL